MQALGVLGIVLAQRALADVQRAPGQRLGLGQVTQRFVQGGQVVQGLCVVGMLLAQGVLANRQRLLKDRLCLFVVADRLVEHGEVVEAAGEFRIVLA